MKRRNFIKAGVKFGALSLLPFQLSACGNNDTEKALMPAARNAHASAFNHDQNELLIFGGSLKNGDDNSLWSFKDGAWKVLSSTGPEKREDALLVYHSQHQKTYLIGGRTFSSNSNFNDFWEWNGARWTQLSNPPFGNLVHASAAYDPIGNRILVFGGLAGSTLSADLWIWDGLTWSKSSSTGPSARLASALLYSPMHEKIYLFGGSLTNGTILREVWELAGDHWLKLNDNHPSILSNAYGVAPLNDNFILFGGFKENRQQGAETWIYNVTENTWTSTILPTPTPRALHSMVCDSANQRVLMFGGSSGGVLLDELWSYSELEWNRIAN